MIFKKDVNGLRAIAILSVLFYHFEIPGFNGGFSGVDIFFVISGYLITNVIIHKQDNDTFTFSGFYLDRAFRILPALLFLCLTLLLAGWVILPPSEFFSLAKHVLSSITFLSNFSFWLEAGYFDTSSRDKWLLHTWSLSVEWQFYLLYPFIIFTAHKLFKTYSLHSILIILTIISFLLCIYFASTPSLSRWSTIGFYLLPTRAWEMLAGGLIYFTPVILISKYRHLLHYFGLLLIAFSTLGLDVSVVWPGWLTIIPVAGCALVILSNNDQTFISRNRTFQRIGSISYSVYLWHWPVVVGLAYFELNNQFLWILTGLTFSILLGQLSYTLIERPIAKLKKTTKYTTSRILAFLPVLICSLLSISVIFNDGFPHRFNETILIADGERLNKSTRTNNCHLTSDPCDLNRAILNSGIIMIGDSNAEAIFGALINAAKYYSPGPPLLISNYGCPTIIGAKRIDTKDRCFDFNNRIITMLASDTSQSSPVIIVNAIYDSNKIGFIDTSNKLPPNSFIKYSFVKHEELYIKTICSISKQRVVYIVKPIPHFDYDIPKRVTRQLIQDEQNEDVWLDSKTYLASITQNTKILEKAAKVCGVKLLDPIPYLCPNDRCMGSLNGRPLYFDNSHLSEYGNTFLIPMFEPLFLD